jgi:hypothetical protein
MKERTWIERKSIKSFVWLERKRGKVEMEGMTNDLLIFYFLVFLQFRRENVSFYVKLL